MKEGKGYGRGGIRKNYPGGTFFICVLLKKKLLEYSLFKMLFFSTVQQSGSAIHIHIFSFFGFHFHLGHHIALRVPCATQSVLISYRFYTQS